MGVTLHLSFEISLPKQKRKVCVCACVCVSGEVCANGHLNAADVTLNSFKGPQVPLDQYWERKK